MPFDNKKRPRGLAFIIYHKHDDAVKAMKQADKGILIRKRKLNVEVFKPLETLNMERSDKKKYLKAKRLDDFRRVECTERKPLSYADMIRDANNSKLPLYNPSL